MLQLTRLAGAYTAIVALLAISALPGSSIVAAGPSEQATASNVIIIMRDQMPGIPGVRGAREARASALAVAQSPILEDLKRSGSSKIHAFGLINAVAATVSQEEAEHLAGHPLVQAVVPDAIIRAPRTQQHPDDLRSATGVAGASSAVAPSVAASSDGGLCNTLEPEALQLTHTAFADAATPQSQTVLDGHGKPVIGSDVRVAFISAAMDPTIAGFVRPDGSRVFFDYQDFTGDPRGTPTGYTNGFGDASSIAAQDLPNGKPLTFDLSKFVNAAHPLPSPCPIRIRGVAPGASLAGLTVFSSSGFASESVLVQAIEWAVTHDDVDVLNESFTSAFYPDTVDDPVSLANHAAVQAGVTVVVSTGFAGPAGTLGSPASDPFVITAGASTQFRSYAQIGLALPLATGFISNNISALSSGGVSQTGARTVDVVAPGDAGWALCSTNVAVFLGCTNDVTLAGLPSAFTFFFGGTAESAPLTSGEAALVIQAYRSTHRGADPTPALVKQIIMSTATDLGAPAYEQGAGLINTLAAVRSALSIQDANGAPKSRGGDLLNAPTSASVIAEPGTPEERSFTITNTGTTTRHICPVLEALGPPIAGATASLYLSATGTPSFIDYIGFVQPYITYQFTVPAGAQHLDAAVAFAVPPTVPSVGAIDFWLLDPSGKQAAYSTPQGLTGYTHADVVKPVPGRWTAVIATAGGSIAQYGYTGDLQLTWSAERFERFGSVSPRSFDLAPGSSKTIRANFTVPSAAGDTSAAIKFDDEDADAHHPDIPVSVRATIPLGPTGGDFTGTLTGSNGAGGSTQTFAFVVPTGIDNMSVTLEISDNTYQLEGVLVDPDGMPLSVQGNLDPSGNPQYGLQLSRANPQAGLWRFLLIESYGSSGNQTSLPFTARVGFDTAHVSAMGLPDNPNIKLSASAGPIQIPVTIVNTGAVTEDYFADARLKELTSITLAPLPSTTTALPGAYGFFNVPTEATGIRFVEQASAPITLDAFNVSGYSLAQIFSPDISGESSAKGTEAVATLHTAEIPNGEWQTVPALAGPFRSTGAHSATVKSSAVLTLKSFDSAVSADSGDLWADFVFGSSTYKPLTVAPGATGVVHLTLSPDPAKVGTTVSGYLYIDTFNNVVFNGDEVVRIPYEYTVAP